MMSRKMLWNAVKLSPAVLGAFLVIGGTALAKETVTVEEPTTTNAGSLSDQILFPKSNNKLPENVTIETTNIDSNPQPNNIQKISNAQVLDQLNNYTAETQDEEADQVTNVNQLRDVRPTDWAFEALRSLVERYGCIAGYPDGTYRGQRALSRFEFAAGVNACLLQIERLIAASTADLITKADLAIIQKLYDEFGAELKTIRARVDNIEGRVTFLEENQFSTTTKLGGEVIWGLADALGDRVAVPSEFRDVPFPNPAGAVNPTASINAAAPRVRGPETEDANTILGARVRLAFKTSFNGTDELFTRLNWNNLTQLSNNNPGPQGGIPGQVTGTSMTRLGFDGGASAATPNVDLNRLWYRFAPGKGTTVFLTATGLEINDQLETFNPFLSSAGGGALSAFGRFNPIYRVNGGSGAGATVIHKFNSTFNISALYSGQNGSSEDPSRNRGLFNGAYSALVQLGINPSKNVGLGLIYARSYYPGSFPGSGSITNVTGTRGSDFANRPFRLPGTGTGGVPLTAPEAGLNPLINPSDTGNVATSADSFALNLSWRVTPRFVISGWGTYQNANAEKTILSNISTPSGNVHLIKKGDQANIWNWAVTFAFPDLGARGNVLGLVFGMPPKATDNDLARRIRNIQNTIPGSPGTITPGRTSFDRIDRDTAYHVEAFYKIRFTDNIQMTPGVIWIINPEHNSRNSDNLVGVIRTTFTF